MHPKQKQGNYIIDFDNINSHTLNVPNIPSPKGAAGFEPVNLLICLDLKSRLGFQGIYILHFDNIKQQRLHFEVRTLVFPKSTIFKGEKLVTTFSEDLVFIHRKEIR